MFMEVVGMAVVATVVVVYWEVQGLVEWVDEAAEVS